jgi:two-component system response regulator MprA
MGKPHRILVVDDDPDIRRILLRFFTDAGHEVRTASDGKAGLDQVREWEPEVVLLDLEMPAMNGLDALRYIDAEHPLVSVVTFSGHAAADHLGTDARRLGAKEFLAKPFDLEQLGTIVENLLIAS